MLLIAIAFVQSRRPVVTYRVTASSEAPVEIVYVTAWGSTERIVSAQLSMERSFRSQPGASVSVLAQRIPANTMVSCEILVDDLVIASATAANRSEIARCDGMVPHEAQSQPMPQPGSSDGSGKDNGEESGNTAATSARSVELTQVAQPIAPTPTSKATEITDATATVQPTNTPEPTNTPRPRSTSTPTNTPEPTSTPRPPTATPEPVLPLSAFQPSSDEFGLTYTAYKSEKMSEPDNIVGFEDGDRMGYVLESSGAGSGPTVIQLSCLRFQQATAASQWITQQQERSREVGTNIQSDQLINSSADETFTMTYLFTGSDVYYVSNVWFRSGITACEYQGFSDAHHLQFMIDMSNRVIGRIQP